MVFLGLNGSKMTDYKYEWQKEANKQRAQSTFSWENTTKKYLEYVSCL